MLLDYQKELTPVLYNESAVKVLPPFSLAAGSVCFHPHWHERMELLLVIGGALRLLRGTEETTVSAGAVAIVPPGVTHGGVATESGVCYHTVMFDVTAFSNAVPGNQQWLTAIGQAGTAFLPMTADADIVETVRTLSETRSDTPTASLFVTAAIYRLFGLLCSRCLTAVPPAPVGDERFRQILSYIATHYSEPLTVAALCRRFGYAEGYFCRRFRTVTGMTPAVYIRVLRLENARRLLENGTGIGAAAAACGFSDHGYFSRCFRRHYGMSPSAYAKKP